MQFILQKSEKPSQIVSSKPEAKSTNEPLANNERSADGPMLEKQSENVGIVKGVPQKHSEASLNLDKSYDKAETTKERKPGQFRANNSNISSENLLDLFNQKLNNSNSSNSFSTPLPVASIGVSGSLKPPAYRNPPAPKIQNQKITDLNNGNFNSIFSPNEVQVHYRDLVQLIKYQREKINTQQNDLTKVISLCSRWLKHVWLFHLSM